MSNLATATIFEWFGRVTPVLVGGVGGYLFYRFVGCKTGSCPITSSPWLSTVYGALLGFLFAVR